MDVKTSIGTISRHMKITAIAIKKITLVKKGINHVLEENIERQMKYLNYLLKHKWYVMRECFKEGLVWRGLKHDMDKFRPSSFAAYSRFFGRRSVRDESGYYKPTGTGDPSFEYAWFRHTRISKHHWQYWVLSTEDNEEIIQMDNKSVREMICDWVGASKAQGGKADVFYWWDRNKNKIKLHPETRIEIEDRLEDLWKKTKSQSSDVM